MTPHRQRLLVALVGIPLLLVVLFAAPPLVFGLVVAAAAVLVQAEFYRLQAGRLSGPEQRLGLGLGALVGAAAAAAGEPAALLAAAVASLLAVCLFALVRPGEAPTAAGRAGLLVFGLAYGPVLLAHLTLLRGLPAGEGASWVSLVLAAVWGGDTAAFYVGRAFGQRKLYPAVSPKKTWEGAAGGLVGTLAAMAVVRAWLLPGLPAGHLLGLGLLAALLGQLGDLCESLLKRGAGVKDSGALLPGHGGVLDRLDSLLFVAPLVYYYARVLEVYP